MQIFSKIGSPPFGGVGGGFSPPSGELEGAGGLEDYRLWLMIYADTGPEDGSDGFSLGVLVSGLCVLGDL